MRAARTRAGWLGGAEPPSPLHPRSRCAISGASPGSVGSAPTEPPCTSRKYGFSGPNSTMPSCLRSRRDANAQQ